MRRSIVDEAMTYAGYAEAFAKIAKYEPKGGSVVPEHDLIDEVSKEDCLRLRQIGCFHKFV